MKLSNGLVVSVVALVAALGASAAHAQDAMWSSPYIEFGGGLNAIGTSLDNLQYDNGINNTYYPASASDLDDMALGGSLYAAFGAEAMPGLRTQVEASVSHNGGQRFNIQAEGSGTLDVDTMTFALMGSVWKDFAVSDQFGIHIGAGLGLGVINATTEDDEGNVSDLSTTGVAYMAGIGADFGLGDSGMKLTLDYKISGVGDNSIGTAVASTYYLNGDTYGDVSATLNQSVTVGLRIPIGE